MVIWGPVYIDQPPTYVMSRTSLRSAFSFLSSLSRGVGEMAGKTSRLEGPQQAVALFCGWTPRFSAPNACVFKTSLWGADPARAQSA